MVSAPTDTNLALWRELGAQTTHDNADVVLGCDVVFLAVKPHIFPEVRITCATLVDLHENLVS